MRIATLQFTPVLPPLNPSNPSTAPNFSRAESLLMREERSGRLADLDLLVLPELAFTGYNFPSLQSIAPYLEPTAAGPSTRWAARTARRLGCTVAVGYPEAVGTEDGEGEAEEGNFNTIYDGKIEVREGMKAYNSLVFVNHVGEVVGHYRKSFLYYTDENWATEGGQGFWTGILPLGGGDGAGEGTGTVTRVKATAGICMDINPYKFEAPWTAYEFANHCREAKAALVVVSMAWLTRLSREEVIDEQVAGTPDLHTVGYWVERFKPLQGPMGSDQEVVVVCANRTGEEGVDARLGEVRYAGSSCVMGLNKGRSGLDGEVRIWDILGRAQEGLLIIDTTQPARYVIEKKHLAEESIEDMPNDGEDDAKSSSPDIACTNGIDTPARP